jgi:predicted permease
LDTLFHDLRVAIRGFARRPGQALAIVATLSVALALNVTAFAVFTAYVLRPVQVTEADSLYRFSWFNQAGSLHRLTWPEYERMRRDTTAVFADVAALSQMFARLDGRVAQGQLVTPNYFSMLGVGASRGRTLQASDFSSPGREPVVVLSHDAWMRIYGGDPAIVGRRIQVRGENLEVVGVTAEGFRGLEVTPQDFWVPLTMFPLLQEGPDLFGSARPEALSVTGRLRPGATTDSARTALMTWARQLTADQPREERAVSPRLVAASTPIPFSLEIGLAFAPVAAAFGLVLITAAANVTGLLLAMAIARRQDVAVRMAIGATHGRIVRQFITESVLLALTSAVGGFVLARVLLDLGVRTVLATLPRELAEYIPLLPLAPDARVLVPMTLAAIAVGLFLGGVPALQATRRVSARGLTADAATSRLRHGLVVAQITVAALLVIACGVLLRGTLKVAGADLGLRTRDVVQIRGPERARATILRTLASSPPVRQVGVGSDPPFAPAPRARVAPLDGTGSAGLALGLRYVSPEYFSVLDIPIVSGRRFTDAESRGGGPVVILSQAAASRLWPARNPIGQTIRLSDDTRGDQRARPVPFPSATVIGVAADVRMSWEPGDQLVLYLPTTVDGPGSLVVFARTAGDQYAARSAIDRALALAAPGGAEQVFILDSLAAARVYPFRAAYWMAGITGMLALLLTAFGIYGTMSHAVARRTREIGIRVALGASSSMILELVLGQAVRLSVVGLTAGTLLALGVSKLLSSAVVMIDTFDLLAYAIGAFVVLTACLAAAFHPARRAARIEPLTALRVD